MIFDEFIKKVEKENKKIIPICSYAQKQFEKRPEIHFLLKGE
ncbi:MAG: N-acetyltransferase [Clostridia bacterium]